MILSIILSLFGVLGVYEYLYDLLPRLPLPFTLPLLVGLSVGAYFLPLTVLGIVAVAGAAGLTHGLIRRRVTTSQVTVRPTRRSGLPPLP